MEKSSVAFIMKDGEKSERFKNAMHIVTMNGDARAIAILKKSGRNINQEENGQTPLHLAVIGGKTLAVRKLVSLGASLRKLNKNGYTPLHLAVLHNRVSLIEDLVSIDSGSDIDIFDSRGNAALHIAVSKGNAKAVRALLIEGADADLPNKKGDAPLHLAILRGNTKVIDVVVKYVRKPNIFDKNKFRPLHLAVLYNQIDTIRKLGKLKGTKVNYLNGDGDAALHLATKLRNLAAIEALLDLKANVNLKNSKYFAPVHLAVIYRKMSAAEILARIDRENRFKNTPVHVSDAQRNLPALRLLCRSKVNVNIRNLYGQCILHSVVETDCEDAVKMLLNLGANPNTPTQFSNATPLHVAVGFGNKVIIELLLQRGAGIYFQDKSGDTPLHSAARFCSSVGIETMIKCCEGVHMMACLERANYSSLTPLDIVMSYVREDTFGTSVQTVNDLYKRKFLERKSPLSPHEVLKCARLLFKFEIWNNLEKTALNNPVYYSNILPILRSYISDCFDEIRLMKFTLLHESFNLYDLAINGWVNTIPLSRACTSEVVLNHMLDISITKVYPIYRDNIVSKLDRYSILKKASFFKIHLTYNGKTIFLDMDALPKYLGNDDLVSLLIAYSNLDSDPGDCKSSDDKKRKLAEP